MNIAVYSGSFNPLHTGHLAILEALSGRGSGFDCTYLVVSPQNPLKDASNAASGPERFRAAVEAIRRHPGLRVRVEDIELGMEPPHYTIRTLEALRSREPGNSFTLVVGADNLGNFTQWREWKRILTEFGIAVFPRRGYHRGHLRARLLRLCPGARITLVAAPRVDISSTEIRSALASGQDVGKYLM